MIDDLLAPERAIVARLKDKISATPVRRVSEFGDLLSGKVKAQTTPAMFVLLSRAGANEKSMTAQIALSFIVVIVTRDVSDIRGAAARDAAGPLAMQAIGALHGWRPCDGFDHLMLSSIDAPILLSGYFMLPLVFTTNTFITGDSSNE